jgi:predicted mannosyl-3-phosphoglycerate phosphatase (HAD superfamily)
MLEIADQALIIKPLKRKPLKINRKAKVSISQEIGPRGWVSGVTDWLQNFN